MALRASERREAILNERPVGASQYHRRAYLAPTQVGEVNPFLQVDGVCFQDLDDGHDVVRSIQQCDIGSAT